MKPKRKFMSGFLCAVLACCMFAGCAKAPSVNYDVWSTYSTLKIMRDEHDYPSFTASIDVEMAKGETEGAQIVLTPEEETSFDLTVSDLHLSDGTVFPKENIAVYVQKMILTNKWNTANTDYPAGYVPDMLLPMDLAKKSGENVVEQGCNQPITIEFKTTSETKAGIYTGNFTLSVGGKTEEIPVKVEVWDIDITQCYGKTAFYATEHRETQLMLGEMDNSVDMERTYFETFLNEYKTCLQQLPVENDTREAWLAEILRYWDNPNFTTFTITPGRGADKGFGTVNSNEHFAKMQLLIENSYPGRILLERAVIVGPDEPAQSAYPTVKRYCEAIDKVEDQILDWLDRSDYYERVQTEGGYTDEEMSAYKAELTAAVDVPVVITTAYNDELQDSVSAYCPKVNIYDTTLGRQNHAATAARSGGEAWWYNCESPQYPYVSNQLDDYLIANRLVRWMQYAYDIDGYLYWAVYLYSKITHGYASMIPVDPYTDPGRYYNVPGDGYYLYPGSKYGSSTPLGSIRAAALRDGQEDFNMLNELENLYAQTAENTETDFDIHAVLQPIYDQLFEGAKYNSDDASFLNLRREVAEMILYAKNYGFNLLDSDIAGTTASVRFVVPDTQSVTVSGGRIVSQTKKNGYIIYTAEIVMDKAENTLAISSSDGWQFNYFVGHKKQLGLDVSESGAQGMLCSDGSSVTVEGDYAVFDLKSRGETDIEMLRLKPYAGFSTSLFDASLDKIEDLMFIVNTSREVTVSVAIGKDEQFYTLDEYCLLPGDNAITVKQIYKECGNLADADKIVLLFSNGYFENGHYVPVDPGIIKISDMYYSTIE